jgi:hypothetical protein
MRAIGKQQKGYFGISRGTIQFGIHYSSRGTPLLVGFTDSNWVGDPDD